MSNVELCNAFQIFAWMLIAKFIEILRLLALIVKSSKYCTECATNFYSFEKLKNAPKRCIFENAPINKNIFLWLLPYFELNLTDLRHQSAPIKMSKEQAEKPF